MIFCPVECASHARSVQVSYSGFRNNSHFFSVSSLSSSSVWSVQVQLSHKFNLVSHPSPEQLLQQGLVRVYSDDPGFRYYGPAYYHTQLNCAIYPEFRAPHPPHDYLCLHTELAVLQLLSNLGPGVLTESFSQVLVWDDSSKCYI